MKTPKSDVLNEGEISIFFFFKYLSLEVVGTVLIWRPAY